jgi:hypothetical protein
MDASVRADPAHVERFAVTLLAIVLAAALACLAIGWGAYCNNRFRHAEARMDRLFALIEIAGDWLDTADQRIDLVNLRVDRLDRTNEHA